MDLVQELREAIRGVEGGYHRLVLLVGRTRTGKTSALRELARQDGFPLLNTNLALSERLLEFTAKERRLESSSCLAKIVEENPGAAVLLDNIEILFARELEQDALRLLQGLARNRTVIAAWDGSIDGASILYAQPGHPEYRRWPTTDLRIVQAQPAGSTAASA